MMTIRAYRQEDLGSCAEILMAVYNNPLWQCRWEKETAKTYLQDYADAAKFIGYVAEDGQQVIGAIFAHEKIWWNNSEVFIDEMFVLPECQGKGIGTALLSTLEEYVQERGMAGFTLTTNRYAPAPQFYKRNGFTECEPIIMMAKEI